VSFLNKTFVASLGIGIICFLAVVASSSAWSAKLYKWVDKNGQTHYSQIPPQKDQVKDKSDVAEKSAGSVIPASRRGDYAYCGGLKLPGPLYKPKNILLGLGDRVESWRRSLRSSEESLTNQLRTLGSQNRRDDKYKSKNTNITYKDHGSEQRRSTSRKIKEYRCAIAWAERQKDKYADIKQEIAHDVTGAKTNYQAALDAAHQECGFEPKDYANPNYNKKKSAWVKCMRPHKRKISSSEKNLQKLRSQSHRLE